MGEKKHTFLPLSLLFIFFFTLQEQQRSPVFVQPAIPKKERRGRRKEGKRERGGRALAGETMTAQGHPRTLLLRLYRSGTRQAENEIGGRQVAETRR